MRIQPPPVEVPHGMQRHTARGLFLFTCGQTIVLCLASFFFSPAPSSAQWIPSLPDEWVAGDSQSSPTEVDPDPAEPAPPQDSRAEDESPPGAAAREEGPPPETAIEFYQRGRRHFDAGRYGEAAEDLERARQLDPESPNLAYNLAKVYELDGQVDLALSYYRGYLALLPASAISERADVAARIERLERIQTDRTTHPTAHADAERATEEPGEGGRGAADAWFWIVSGISASAVIAGVVVGVFALERRAQLDDYVVGSFGRCITSSNCTNSWDERAGQVRALAVTTDVLFATGAAAGVGALLLYLLRWDDAEDGRRWDEGDGNPGVSPSVIAHADGFRIGATGRW